MLTCHQILAVAPARWSFLEVPPGVEPTSNAAERALRQAVIHRKLSYGVQSPNGGRCLTRLPRKFWIPDQKEIDAKAVKWDSLTRPMELLGLVPCRT